MSLFNRFAVYLTLAVCAGTTTFAQEDNSSAAPVAYVYVARPTHLDGFAASSKGVLTPVPGSPFAGIVLTHLNVNKNFLFGPSTNGSDIYSYSIASNGSVKQVSVINAQNYNSSNCGGMGPTALDATGTTLYNIVNSECEYLIQSYKIESNGDLQYLGTADSGEPSDVIVLSPLSVLGDNKYAFQAACGGDSFPGGGVIQYKRESSGLLTVFGNGVSTPATQNPDYTYCPYWAIASDPSDHFAVVLQLMDDSFDDVGPNTIATYSVPSNGDATTTSTYKNMPSEAVGFITTMSISPSGKLLALGGSNGFQLWHYNGGSPATKFSGALLAGTTIQQFAWDSSDHLYALTSGGQLLVYTISGSSVKEASGSPYSIPEASSLVVFSK